MSLKIVLILANSADPDKKQHDAAFHLGLHCLPKYRLGVSSPQRVINTNLSNKINPFMLDRTSNSLCLHCRSRGCEFDPAQPHAFMEIDYGITSMVILLLPLIQE